MTHLIIVGPMYACMYYMYACTHTCSYAGMRVCVYVCIRIHTYTHTRVCMHEYDDRLRRRYARRARGGNERGRATAGRTEDFYRVYRRNIPWR